MRYMSTNRGVNRSFTPVCTQFYGISYIKAESLQTRNEYAGHERGCVERSPLTVCFGLSWMQIKKDGVGKTAPIAPRRERWITCGRKTSIPSGIPTVLMARTGKPLPQPRCARIHPAPGRAFFPPGEFCGRVMQRCSGKRPHLWLWRLP